MAARALQSGGPLDSDTGMPSNSAAACSTSAMGLDEVCGCMAAASQRGATFSSLRSFEGFVSGAWHMYDEVWMLL